MKKIIFTLLISMVIVFSAEAHKKSNVTISVQTFYDQLSPYGDWIYSYDYGYVWRPYFDNPQSFRPYSSGGNWVYTSYGWTWVSDYTWGWATFHYGRWDFDNYLGWLWVPGTEWAPAWVSWGSYDNYWGWAPMGPNIYAQTNSSWYAPDPWWTFVSRDRFYSGNWKYYIYDRPVRVTNITYITNVYTNKNSAGNHNSWYEGPRVSDVDRYSKTKVRTIKVVDNQRAGNTGVRNNTLNVYRPSVETKNNEYRPTRYTKVEQARTGRQIEQTSARSNDPGVSRTRETRTETRTNTQTPVQRNTNVTNEKSVVPSSTNRVQNSRSSEVQKETNSTQRTNTQTRTQNGSVNKETKVEPRMGTQVYPERSSSRPSTETKTETPARVNNSGASERNTTATPPARVEPPSTTQPRNSAPDLQKVYSSPTRETGKSTTPTTQPTREPKTQTTAPTSGSRNQTTVTKQASREVVKQAETKSPAAGAERDSSGKPARR